MYQIVPYLMGQCTYVTGGLFRRASHAGGVITFLH